MKNLIVATLVIPMLLASPAANAGLFSRDLTPEELAAREAAKAAQIAEDEGAGRCFVLSEDKVAKASHYAAWLKDLYKNRTNMDYDKEEPAGQTSVLGSGLVGGMAGTMACVAGIAITEGNPIMFGPCAALVGGGAGVGVGIGKSINNSAERAARRSANDPASVSQGEVLKEKIGLTEFNYHANVALAEAFYQTGGYRSFSSHGFDSREFFPSEKGLESSHRSFRPGKAYEYFKKAYSYLPEEVTQFTEVKREDLERAAIQLRKEYNDCKDPNRRPEFGDLVRIILENKNIKVAKVPDMSKRQPAAGRVESSEEAPENRSCEGEGCENTGAN